MQPISLNHAKFFSTAKYTLKFYTIFKLQILLFRHFFKRVIWNALLRLVYYYITSRYFNFTAKLKEIVRKNMYSRRFLNQIHKLSSTDMLLRSLLATIQKLIKLLKIVDADRKCRILTCLNFALKTIPCAPSPIFPKIVYCSITYVPERIFTTAYLYFSMISDIYCKNEK